MRHPSLSLYDYTDYRRYLAAYYQICKESERGFSHRVFAARLGFASPNFLKLVMDGGRSISKKSLDKITSGLKLNKLEAEYFSYLVFFGQAKNSIDKNYYFGLIASLRSRKSIAPLAQEQFEYLSEWYHPAVRELVSGLVEPLDYESLSRRLRKEVSAAKIGQSVELLKRLNLVRLDESNTYVPSSPLLNTENELNSFSVRHYHAEILGIARKAIDTIPPQDREFSHSTIKTSAEGFARIKRRIQEFREEILQIVKDEQAAEEIFHVNFQLYPIVESSIHESNP